MRFAEMQEKERARRANRVEPVFGNLLRLGAVAHQRISRSTFVRWQFSVEEGKPARDAGIFPQQERRHDSAGRVSAVAQQLGHRPRRIRQPVAGHVANACLEWQATGQQGRMRRKGLRHVRVRSLEDD